MVQLLSLCVTSGVIFVLGAGSAIFGLLKQFPISNGASLVSVCAFWRDFGFRGWECDFRTPEAIPDRMVQVPSQCVPSGATFVLGAGSAIFGLLRRFPIEWCKSRLCACHLVRFSF